MLTVIVAGRAFRGAIHSRQARVAMLMCSSGTFEFELDPGMRPRTSASRNLENF